MRKTSDIKFGREIIHSLPLRREVSAVSHFIRTSGQRVRVGLDIGFTHAGASRILSHCGGYWVSVEPTLQRRNLVATVLGEDRVLCSGADGELPFEDKQFDVVVLSRGTLADVAAAGKTVRECHRVLKNGAVFLLTVEYRKKFGFASAFNRQRPVSGAGASFNEADIFRLLKDGFDVLGFRYTCRFWVQLVRQWVDRSRSSGGRRPGGGWLRLLYGLALVADVPLFFTRGHQMTVYARRKGWRSKHTKLLGSRTPVSDAILFDPRRESGQASFVKFK
ncbi:MAG: methyltransferase domain-containing protein [Kiritimatiellae bacterium]|nr:methyltransferase domain-containing protein [Kiritimatiellia bacterium]